MPAFDQHTCANHDLHRPQLTPPGAVVQYTAFLQSDRQYFATDVANGLYCPSVCLARSCSCRCSSNPQKGLSCCRLAPFSSVAHARDFQPGVASCKCTWTCTHILGTSQSILVGAVTGKLPANHATCLQAYYAALVTAQTPVMVVNTVLGSLIAYGMGNLNHSAKAIVLSMLLLVIGALGGMQLLCFCTLALPNTDLVRVFTICAP